MLPLFLALAKKMRTEGKEKNIIGLAVLLVLVFEAALISASAASVLDDRHHGKIFTLVSCLLRVKNFLYISRTIA